MKKSTILCVALATIAFAGCSKDETNTSTDERVALSVTSGIQTRAYDNTWEAGDAIGIYMVKLDEYTTNEDAENCRYSTPDGGNAFGTPQETTIYFPVDGSQVDFLAYYPYQETLPNGEIIFSVSDQSDLSAIDLMVAKVKSTDEKPVDKNHPQVALHFAHILTKLELNIYAGNGVSTDELKGLKVEITNQRTEGIYALLFEGHGVVTDPILPVVLNTNAEGTLAQAILLPNDVGGNHIISEREFVFSLAAGGEVFKWSIPNGKSFKRGEKNIYKITINRTTSLGGTTTITDWNKGNGENGESGNAE